MSDKNTGNLEEMVIENNVLDFEVGKIEDKEAGHLTEKDKLSAAKQILLALGVVFLIIVGLYFIRPATGEPLLEVAKLTIPPLATLIIAFYFNHKK